MQDKLQTALLADFPQLYQNEHLRKNGYFSVGDGWEPIIRKLSEKVFAEYLTLSSEQQAQWCVIQVKEKFGGLRYYYDGVSTEGMAHAIDEAEKEAYRTCEVCGAPGTNANVCNWTLTLCHQCYLTRMLAKGNKLIKCCVCGKSDACKGDMDSNAEYYTDLPYGWYVIDDRANGFQLACSLNCAKMETK